MTFTRDRLGADWVPYRPINTDLKMSETEPKWGLSGLNYAVGVIAGFVK